MLPEKFKIGLSSQLKLDDKMEISFFEPTKVFDHQLNFDFDGIKFELYHLPGETDDHVNIFLPDQNVFFIGDNFYEAFPNLYAIRGTPARNAKKWSSAVRKAVKIIEEAPGSLAPSPRPDPILIGAHFEPKFGYENIIPVLKTYSDGIRFIHDNTVRLMNKNTFSNSEIVKIIKDIYPAKFKNFMPLREFYGTLEWGVKGIIDSYVGWFDGRVENLKSFKNRNFKYTEMLGGCRKITETAQKIIDDYKIWNSKLDFKLDQSGRAKSGDWSKSSNQLDNLLFALDLASFCGKSDIYRELSALIANEQSNPLARNYYLAEAFNLDMTIPKAVRKNAIKNEDGVSLRQVFETMTMMFQPGYEKVKRSYWAQFKVLDGYKKRSTVGSSERYYNLVFSNFCYHSFQGFSIDDGLLSVGQMEGQVFPDFQLTISERDLRDFLTKPGLTILTALFKNEGIEMSGDKITFLQFLSFLDNS